MKKKTKQNSLLKNAIGKLTILQLMASLAILGILVWCIGRWLLG